MKTTNASILIILINDWEQALLGLNEVTKEIFLQNSDFFPIKPVDHGKFLVLSLGTGSAKQEGKLNASKASKWGVLGWLYNNGMTPLIDSFSQASSDMVDIHASVIFQALHCESNYLRIQVIITLLLAAKRNDDEISFSSFLFIWWMRLNYLVGL